MNINDFGMPHTSIGGDREYGSAEWREYFNTLYENGVVPGRDNELEVKPQGAPNKTVYIDLGAIFINGAIRIVDSVINLSFTDNTSGSTRIDRVVARLNLQEATRKIEFAVLEGTAGGGAPSLTQTADIYELSLAQVELANGYSTITTSEITDDRYNESVFGIAKTLGQLKFEQENNFSRYDKDVISVDADNMPTEVHYKRDDGTLAIKQTASNPDTNGYYQTIVETFYEEDGTTVYKTITYSLTYLSNGIIDTSSKAVSY